jgi:hypothetical protein
MPHGRLIPLLNCSQKQRGQSRNKAKEEGEKQYGMRKAGNNWYKRKSQAGMPVKTTGYTTGVLKEPRQISFFSQVFLRPQKL